MDLNSMSGTFILDGGGATAKFGWAHDSEPSTAANAVLKSKKERKRVFVADELSECPDTTGLFYLLPSHKGYTVNWDVQQQIWQRLFTVADVHAPDAALLLTQPLFNFMSIQKDMHEIVYEHFEFREALAPTAAAMSAYHYAQTQPGCNGTCLILDAGYSFSHVVPFVCGRLLPEAVLRLSVGGKLLTNQLKEVVSYRQLQMMEETHIMNECKQDACFVAGMFEFEPLMQQCRKRNNPVERDYVLPDFVEHHKGYVAEPAVRPAGQTVLRLGHERFSIAELLFRPTDVGLREMGVAEASAHCIHNLCPTASQARLFKNMLLTGGSTMFPGFADRFRQEVGSQCPDLYELGVVQADKPVTYAWHGAKLLAQSDQFASRCVTRAEYLEHGDSICERRFNQPFDFPRHQMRLCRVLRAAGQHIFVHNKPEWPAPMLDTALQSLTYVPDFISEAEETALSVEVEQPLRRLRYETEHWDDAIYLYREIERTKWSASTAAVLDRLRARAFGAAEPLHAHVHALDLHKEGHIKPHIDSTRYCGDTVAGLSLLSPAVMRLRHTQHSQCVLDMLLLRRSLYIMTHVARYDFTHEILPNDQSTFDGQPVLKDRRISIMCRDLPKHKKSEQ